MSENTVLAKKVKRLRRNMRESQIDFAGNCDISVETLSLIERERTDPKLSTIQKIAAYANCSVSKLLDVNSSTDMEA